MSTPSYPVGSARGATDTSHAASRSIDLSVPRLQRIALAAIRAAGGRGLTTHELARTVNIDRDVIQPRTSELRGRGLIRDSGVRRRNASGRLAIVWTAGGLS